MSEPLERRRLMIYTAAMGPATTAQWPSSTDVAAAAAWASARGEYRIARALMTLAVELADREADDNTTRALASAIRSVPKLNVPMRADQPRTREPAAAEPTANLPIFDQASDGLGDTAVMDARDNGLSMQDPTLEE